MRTATYLLILVFSHLSSSSSAQSGIASPTKGAEIPDDYAEAIDKLEKDIGRSTLTHEPKRLHKRDFDSDELNRWKTQVDERQKKRKSKGFKGMMDPREIATKTDEELLEIFYAEQDEMRSHMDEMYNKVTEKLKGEDLSTEERERHTKRKEMIEKRKERYADDQKKRAQRYIEHMRKRAEVMAQMGEEL